MTSFLVPIAQLAAAAVYLAIGYVYLISGLAVPVLFLLPLWTAWVAILVVGFTHRHNLRYLVAAPVGAALFWAAVVLGLGSVFDWRA